MQKMWTTMVWVLLLVHTACSQPIKTLWKAELGASSLSTPLITDTYIAAGTALGVTLLDLNGAVRCHFDAHGEVISAPRTDGKRIFFGSTNYLFYAIGDDCTEKWQFPARDRIKSDPLVHDGVVYITSYDGHVYALRAESGKKVWQFPKTKGAETKEPLAHQTVGDFSYSSPALSDGIIYVGNLDGYLYALRSKDGVMQWRHQTDGPVTSTPHVAGNIVFVGSNDGYLYALDGGAVAQSKSATDLLPKGNRRVGWRFKTLDWINSSPILYKGDIYVGSNDRHVYGIAARTGKLRWRFATQGPAIAIPAVYKNLVFAAGGSGDGHIYAIHRQDGTLFWKYKTNGKIDSDPIIVGDKLYVTCDDGLLYAFRIIKTTSGEAPDDAQ